MSRGFAIFLLLLNLLIDSGIWLSVLLWGTTTITAAMLSAIVLVLSIVVLIAGPGAGTNMR